MQIKDDEEVTTRISTSLLLAPMQLPTPSAPLPPSPPTATNPKAESVENISSTIERTPIENFGQFKSED
ncbi:unnamed protein product, partial [Rotaria magnacalcarata]